MNGDIGDGRTNADGDSDDRSKGEIGGKRGKEGRKEERKIGERKWLTRDAQIWPPKCCCSNWRTDDRGLGYLLCRAEKLMLYLIQRRD